ncbi:LacI family transcriptional regulator [Pedobacter yulinensis]|uniref:LacI family transcriptional regulator n=1 Tax=Pedobacter yulinensis TaxID=2126353 RepID=A0A2T3HL11_9SPHI|nr:substrate-binding domain-containing protein [Pedobacter yulinensis]PST83071.1 LacI family transcriptional regulator [Pedobacter yulinensis]
MKRVSIKDIAQAVGVSTALVSYVLNNKEKEARVGQKIAEVIRVKARELGYQPNQIAKSLKTGRSQTIGLIVADISNPFFANIARTIEDEAKKYNYTVIFGSSDEAADKSQNLINILLERQVDGFIIAPTEGSEEQIRSLQDQRIPFVLIDRYFPDIQTNFVVTNNYQASYQAVRHLAGQHRKKIAMIAYKSELVHMKERERGYLDALKDSGLDSDLNLVKEISYNFIQREVGEVMGQLMRGHPDIDAFFFGSNALSMGGLRYLNRNNYRIPETISVVCFDESEAFDLFYAPLTFVNQPLLEMGKEAVRILAEQISGKQPQLDQVFVDSALIVREKH